MVKCCCVIWEQFCLPSTCLNVICNFISDCRAVCHPDCKDHLPLPCVPSVDTPGSGRKRPVCITDSHTGLNNTLHWINWYQSLYSSQVTHAARGYPGFLNVKQLGVYYHSPLDGVPVHQMVNASHPTPPHPLPLPLAFHQASQKIPRYPFKPLTPKIYRSAWTLC